MDKVTIFRPKLIVAQEISLSWLRLPTCTCTDKILVPQYSIFNLYTDSRSGRDWLLRVKVTIILQLPCSVTHILDNGNGVMHLQPISNSQFPELLFCAAMEREKSCHATDGTRRGGTDLHCSQIGHPLLMSFE